MWTRHRPGLLFLVLLVTIAGCTETPERRSFTWETMGTVARIEVAPPRDLGAADARDLVAAAYDSVNAVFNSWDETSELSRLNRAPAGTSVAVSPWLADCLQQAGRLQQASGGAFDPTAGPLMRLWGFRRREGRLPSPAELDSTRALLGRWRFAAPDSVVREAHAVAFDLGGIAKGFAVDRAAEAWRRAGVTDGLIDLGGNLFCLGGAEGRDHWRVGVRDPLDRDRFCASLAVTGKAVSTSGSYERFVVIDGVRYGHIMNPATGRPATGVLAVTVVAPTAVQADGLSTTLFVLGPAEGRKLLESLATPVEALMMVEGDGPEAVRVLATPGLASRMVLADDYRETYAVEAWASQ